MNKVLVSPSSFGKCGYEPLDILVNNGYEPVINPYGRKLTEEDVITLGKECVGIVAGVEPLNKTVIDALLDLRCISRVGVGMDSIDLEYAKKKNIIVKNTPDGPSRAVAELTIGLTFALLRRIPQADSNIKNGIWKKEIGNLLDSKIIGIIGLGRIGKITAELFLGLGNEVVVYDKLIDENWTSVHKVKVVEQSELLKSADIITIHIPPNINKTPIIGLKELNLLKKTAFIINISRGGVVDEESLFKILINNKIAGAAIDVFDKEPYNGPFTTLKNVVLTPHLGSYAAEGKLKMEIDAVKNLIESLR